MSITVTDEMIHKACDIYDANCVYKNVGIDSVAMQLALQAAFDAMPQQEPVGEVCNKDDGKGGYEKCAYLWTNDIEVRTKLYTGPQPQREPLSVEQIKKILDSCKGTSILDFVCEIEKAHGITE